MNLKTWSTLVNTLFLTLIVSNIESVSFQYQVSIKLNSVLVFNSSLWASLLLWSFSILKTPELIVNLAKYSNSTQLITWLKRFLEINLVMKIVKQKKKHKNFLLLTWTVVIAVPVLCIVGHSTWLVQCILEIFSEIVGHACYFWHTAEFALICTVYNATFWPNLYVLLV